MTVESFDPGNTAPALNVEILDRLLVAASESPPEFGLSMLERSNMGGVMTLPAADWMAAVAERSSPEVESLVRFFTLAEEAIGGWQAGDKSPVIALVKVLKGRGDYPAELTRWIKANTSNRFLPRGSLMDRL